MIVVGLAGAAWSAVGTARDAWPSLPVEQPVVVPRGWTLVELGYAEVHTDTLSRRAGRAEVRYGFSERVELWVTGGGGRSEVDDRPSSGLTAPSFGGRWSLGRAEAPTRSAGLRVAAECPWDDGVGLSAGTGGATLGLEGAAQLGPTRWSGAAGLRWRAPGGAAWAGDAARLDAGEEALLTAAVLLQLGPLAPGFRAEGAAVGPGELDGAPLAAGWWVRGAGTGVVQFSRGLGLSGALTFPLGGASPLPQVEPLGAGTELGLRVAW